MGSLGGRVFVVDVTLGAVYPWSLPAPICNKGEGDCCVSPIKSQTDRKIVTKNRGHYLHHPVIRLQVPLGVTSGYETPYASFFLLSFFLAFFLSFFLRNFELNVFQI